MAFFSFKKRSLLLCIFFCWLSAHAQNQDSLQTQPPKQEEDNIKYPQLQIKGLFQARYLVGNEQGC
jgi:hypothetical protein